jgi:hypothetical protein
MHYVSLLTAAAVTATPLAAQAQAQAQAATAAVTAAAEAIGAVDVARHIGVITADSLKSRETPSRGLELTARYVADQFKKLGLLPSGDQTPKLDSAGQSIMVSVSTRSGDSHPARAQDTSFFQRYPLLGNRTVDYAESRIDLMVKLRKGDKLIVDDESRSVEKYASISFADDAYFAVDTVPASGAKGDFTAYAPPQAFVVAGPHTVESARRANLQDKIVLYVPHERADSAAQRQIIDLLYASNHVLVLSAGDSVTFAARRRAAVARPTLVVDRYMEEALGVRHWAAYVRSGAVKHLLAGANLDPAQVRAASEPVVRELPSLRASLDLELGAPKDSVTAPNVVAVVPGTDSSLKYQYIVFSAHMDHTGAGGGAADNAAGVAGLVELAKAFSQPGTRPKRSILFAALSGGTKGFSGANYFVASPRCYDIESIAANITLGPIGRNSPDSVTVDGIRDLELSVRPDWVAARHPRLKLAVADGGTIASATADHLPFVRKALPSLYFHSGDGSGDNAGAAAKVDAEHAARVLRLAYYFGQDLANADQRPTWTQAGRRDRVKFLGQ